METAPYGILLLLCLIVGCAFANPLAPPFTCPRCAFNNGAWLSSPIQPLFVPPVSPYLDGWWNRVKRYIGPVPAGPGMFPAGAPLPAGPASPYAGVPLPAGPGLPYATPPVAAGPALPYAAAPVPAAGPGFPYAGAPLPAAGPGFPYGGAPLPAAGPGFPYAGAPLPAAGPGLPYAGAPLPAAGPGLPYAGAYPNFAPPAAVAPGPPPPPPPPPPPVAVGTVTVARGMCPGGESIGRLCDAKRPWPQCPPQSYCFAVNSVDIGPYYCCPVWSTYGAAWRPQTWFYPYFPPNPYPFPFPAPGPAPGPFPAAGPGPAPFAGPGPLGPGPGVAPPGPGPFGHAHGPVGWPKDRKLKKQLGEEGEFTPEEANLELENFESYLVGESSQANNEPQASMLVEIDPNATKPVESS